MKDEASDIALRRRLQAAGCPIPADPPSEPPVDLLIEVARPESTVAYEERGGGVELVFSLRITNRSYTRLILRRFEAFPIWEGVVQWRGDPRICSPEKTVYRLENGREFPCETILNYRTGEPGTIEPGESIEGVLLGYTMFDPIPCYYIHGTTAPVELRVIDQFDRPHWAAEFEMLIDRTATMKPDRPARTRSTLFDGPKPERHSFSRWVPPRNESGTESDDRPVEPDENAPGSDRRS